MCGMDAKNKTAERRPSTLWHEPPTDGKLYGTISTAGVESTHATLQQARAAVEPDAYVETFTVTWGWRKYYGG